MALPQGFDPRNMSFGPSQPVIEIPRNSTSSYTSSSSRRRYRESLWSRFNNAIADFGNLISDSTESIVNVMSLIAAGGIVLTALIWVIGIWVEEGFIWALLAGFAAYFIGAICIGLAWYAVNIVMNIFLFCLRFLFWNGWTLVLTLTVAGGLLIFSSVASNNDYQPQTTQVQTTAPTTTTYICTAGSVLNIRSSASINASVIGTLQPGQRVEVYNIVNGFAKFKYNNSYGYASIKYLKRANQ